MNNDIQVKTDGSFLRYGKEIINRAQVKYVRFFKSNVGEKGEFCGIWLVGMNSERNITVPAKVGECWFRDIMDFKKLEEDGRV